MQTQYKLLYRYMNETTNTAITNEAEYNKTEEFYTQDHKYNITESQLTALQNAKYNLKYAFDAITASEYVGTLKKESEDDREQIITENMANQEKSNLLFAYDGTKRIYHKKFIPEQLGYKVRDWTKVPTEQIPSGPDDFSKHFVMLGGYQLGVDDAYLVCKPQFISLYKKYKIVNAAQGTAGNSCFLCLSGADSKNQGYKHNIDYYHKHTYLTDLKKIIDEEVFFEWYDINNENITIKYNEQPLTNEIVIDQTTPYNDPKRKVVTKVQNRNYYPYQTTSYFYFFWDNANGLTNVPGASTQQTSNPTLQYVSQRDSNGYLYYWGWDEDTIFSQGYNFISNTITINDANIIKEIIPEHYEDVGSNPYIIKDTYKPIPLSPWMIHSAHHSLESALTAAKTLVSMVGINNVKLIKYVPLDQFIKIK